MTLSISDQPSQWRRLSDHPKRLSLLSDATIDPFPQRVTRSASLLEHHIVRDSPLDSIRRPDDGRRSTVPFLPYHASPLPIGDLHHPHDPAHSGIDFEGGHDISRKRKASIMTDRQPSGSLSPSSVGQPDGQTQFCLCQPEPKIPRPRNGKHILDHSGFDNIAQAFILYRQHQQAAVVRSHPGLPNPAISKIIGEQWSHLPEEEKDKWKALAEEEKARHAQQYPEYRYQPRRNGRYSSQSSGSGPPSGGKVDQNGNCIKCGGKTMNPPNTPYTVYPTTPPATGIMRPSQTLTYHQGHRTSRQVFVSPPQTGGRPHGDRMWVQPPHRDPRFDPRPRYISEHIEGHDLKRRRFDSGYASTREVYREVPYPYSPRDAQYVRTEMPNDMHAPRSAMVPPPRVLYPQVPPLPPKLQSVRPPPPQHKRNPSLTLPPLTTPATSTPSGSIARSGSQNSGLEAMIMSIPVLNKVKILSQISPHLSAPSVASPPREIRGAIVAVEGLDPVSVYSMTNSLAEQLVKDGKFSVRIFTGPDPFATLRGDGKKRRELAIADCLSSIGEWHRISEEMKRYITTKPVISDAVSPDQDVQMSTSMTIADAKRNSVVMTDADQTSSQTEVKTPDRPRRPSRLDLNPPEKEKKAAQDESTTPPTSGKSTVSPRTQVTNGTADLTITTPPVRRGSLEFKNPWYKGGNLNSPPYTRIPSIAQQGRGMGSSPETAGAADKEQQDGKDGKGKEVHFEDSEASQTSTSTTSPKPASASISTSTHGPSLSTAHTTISSGDGPIPIALVPHYQLTTVDASAISMPIVDSYSPLAHWQWLATLWRGCIGPDVSVVIKSTAAPGEVSEFGSISVAPASNEDGGPGKTGAAGVGAGSTSRDATIATATPRASVAAGSVGPGANAAAVAPGVEVRLLDCRAVVVRTNVTKDMSTKEGEGEGNGEKGKEVDVEKMEREKKRNEVEFWEKAKRRVGFEVAEFLRR